MKRFFSEIVLLFLLIPQAKPNIDLVQDEQQDTAQIYGDYLKAHYLHMMGKVPEAFKSYQQVFKKNPSPYAYDGFFQLLFDVRQYDGIVGLYEKKVSMLRPVFKDNLDVQLIIAQAYLSCNQETKAEKLFSELAAKYQDNELIAYHRMVALIQSNQLDQALVFIDECLKKQALRQKYFLFYFLKSKILLQKNQAAQAMAMIKESLRLFPGFDRGWLLKASILEQQGKINDAISGYKKFLSIVGSEQAIEKQLIQLLFSQKRFDEASLYLKRMKGAQPEYQFDLAIVEFNAEHYEQALEHINACLVQNPGHNQAKLLKVDILLAQKRRQEALVFLQGCLEENPHDNVVIHSMLLLRRSGITCAELIKSIETVKNKKAETLELFSALADLYIENGEYQKGVGYYKNVFNLTPNEELKSKILYHITYIYFTTKNYAQLDILIPKALKFNPISSDLYNLIAFYYVQTNQKLDQALDYVEKALVVDPQSPYYLDTKGVILMKLGERDKALGFLNVAHEQAPGDSTIIEHMQLAQS